MPTPWENVGEFFKKTREDLERIRPAVSKAAPAAVPVRTMEPAPFVPFTQRTVQLPEGPRPISQRATSDDLFENLGMEEQQQILATGTPMTPAGGTFLEWAQSEREIEQQRQAIPVEPPPGILQRGLSMAGGAVRRSGAPGGIALPGRQDAATIFEDLASVGSVFETIGAAGLATFGGERAQEAMARIRAGQSMESALEPYRDIPLVARLAAESVATAPGAVFGVGRLGGAGIRGAAKAGPRALAKAPELLRTTVRALPRAPERAAEAISRVPQMVRRADPRAAFRPQVVTPGAPTVSTDLRSVGMQLPTTDPSVSGAARVGGNTQNLPMLTSDVTSKVWPAWLFGSSSRRQAKEVLDQEFFTSVRGSPVDEATTAYWRSGNFEDYLRVSKARVGEAFPVLPEFAAATFRDIPSTMAGMVDPTRLIQAIDQGVFGGALQKSVLWVTRRSFLARLQFGDNYKAIYNEIINRNAMSGLGKRRLRRLSSDVLDQLSSTDAALPTATLIQRRGIRRVVGGLTQPEQTNVVQFAQETRPFLDNMLVMQNGARAARGQKLIPYVREYRPWVRDRTLWAKLGLRDQPIKDIAKGPLPPDFLRPRNVFTAHTQARAVSGLQAYAKVDDIERLVMDYVDSASKDIFYTDIVQNAKVHIKALEAKGVPNSAAAVEEWIMESFAGKMPTITKAIRERVPILSDIALGIKRSLTRAVFPLNWTWNIFVQTSSLSLTVHRYGIQDTLRGLSYLTDPSVRKLVRANAYSAIIKQRRGGRMALQEMGSNMEKTAELQRSPIEKAEDFANILTNFLEDNLTGISIRAAYHSGKREGLKGRTLWEFASEGGSKTQSMYNLEDLPGILRAREVGAFFPFQTFALEVMNTVREVYGMPGIPMVGKFATGTYRTQQNRILSLARWLAAMYAFNVVADKAIDRKPWQLSSFIPFFAILTSGVNAGNPWNQPLPVKYGHDFSTGIKDLFNYGSWKKLRKFAVGYHMLGGTQINRTMEGIEAVAEGKVRSPEGIPRFDISPDEAWKVIARGPYASSEGREYIEAIDESKGKFYQYTGIPLNLRAMGRQRRAWNKEFKDYYDIPSEASELEFWQMQNRTSMNRAQYRRDNPELDAKMFILSKVDTIKSPQAEQFVKRLVAQHNINPMDIRAVNNYLEVREFRQEHGLGRPEEKSGESLRVQMLIEDLMAPTLNGQGVLQEARSAAQQTMGIPVTAATTGGQSNGMATFGELPSPSTWEIVSADLDAPLLRALAKVWHGGALSGNEEERLRAVYQRHPLGTDNFSKWLRQVLRQVFENEANARQPVLA
jgi:hypothetical protein